jgi:hypothetical protein
MKISRTKYHDNIPDQMEPHERMGLKTWEESRELKQKYNQHLAIRFNELGYRIPPILLEKNWYIQLDTAFNLVVQRFQMVNGFTGKRVWVYLDAFDQSGLYGAPYWEVYDGDDIERFPLEKDAKELLEHIALKIN